MRITDRYVLREFISYLGLALFGLLALFIIVDVFEKIDVFLDHRAPLLLVARMYLFQIPEWVVLVLPIALLLSTFLSLGQLNKFGELTAMRSVGLSLVRILAPVFAVAALGTIGAFLFNEIVTPRATRLRDRIYDVDIQKHAPAAVNERADMTYLGEGGRIYYARLYVLSEHRMHEVSLQEFKGGQLARRIDAVSATWDGRQWVFENGYVRTFDKGVEQAHSFSQMAVEGLPERPDDFAREKRDPREMDYLELERYIGKLRASGARIANYLVDLHMKLSFPLINFIVVMIGAAVATRLRLQSAALGFGLSIVIAFVYYAFMRAGQAFGHSGLLPPYMAAWLGDVVFGSVGATMMWRAQRR
jgi:lipopolysaccharide export system permease protein